MPTEPRFEANENHIVPSLREVAQAKGMNFAEVGGRHPS